MSLHEKITADMKTAMKGKQVETLSVLRMLLASLKNKAIDLRRELEDAEVTSVIRSDIKKIEDALESFVAGEREDLADKARNELKVLKSYLPPEMSDEDLELAIKKVIDELEEGDALDIGKAMGKAMQVLKGQADGARVKAMLARMILKK
ncbi:GatB/YqeY domain-containing protein [Patescibacteria group bacterium]|nr:GatB/YqeY domain-containing protein [Patescibacteria group bacterium]MBU4453416.1 GatB/YqeY domain-containing protein [Patescibacteria group bacterium]MCG2687854.1 GatB/YqeY domain-containing protein [Candidatus Parcubacteria bacterium]